MPEAGPEVAREAKEPVRMSQSISVAASEACAPQISQVSQMDREFGRKAEPLRQAAECPEQGDRLCKQC